jgi:hypothetical protein
MLRFMVYGLLGVLAALWAALWFSSAPASNAHTTLATSPSFDMTRFAFNDVLPAGFTYEPISSEPSMFSYAALPTSHRSFDRRFTANGDVAGGLTAWQYDTQADSGFAYDQLAMLAIDQTAADVVAKPVRGLGDRAVAGRTVTNYDLAMQRGCVVVYVRMRHIASISDVIAYAKRLDARLQAAACQRPS